MLDARFPRRCGGRPGGSQIDRLEQRGFRGRRVGDPDHLNERVAGSDLLRKALRREGFTSRDLAARREFPFRAGPGEGANSMSPVEQPRDQATPHVARSAGHENVSLPLAHDANPIRNRQLYAPSRRGAGFAPANRALGASGGRACLSRPSPSIGNATKTSPGCSSSTAGRTSCAGWRSTRICSSSSARSRRRTPRSWRGTWRTFGPTFIKLGQLLSTRADPLPPIYLTALARLQDDVEPFSFAEVEKIVTTELSVRISKAFSSFDAAPLAAASLGQVHRAVLRDGRSVAVKVQRPGIREQVLGRR